MKIRLVKTLLIAMITLLLGMIPMQCNVKASTNSLTLEKSKITLKSGENLKLKVKKRTYKKDQAQYFYWTSSDESVATVSSTGKVTARVPGTAIITLEEVYYTDYETVILGRAECKVTVKKGAYSLKKHKITLVEEDSYRLAIPEGITVNCSIDYAKSNGWATIEKDKENNRYNITATNKGICVIDVKYYQEKKYLCSDRLTIEILRRGIGESEVSRAVGKSYQLQVNGYDNSYNFAWSSSDPDVATVSSTGKVKALKEGECTINLQISDKEYNTWDYDCYFYVSNPTLEKKEQNLCVSSSDQIVMNGLSYGSVIESVSSNSTIVEVYENDIYAKAVGTATITLNVDGVKFKYKIRVIDPKVNDELIVLQKGKSKTIKVTGANKYSKITYRTSNKNIATVSKSGKVKAIKNGTATITIQVDEKTFLVPVSISNEKVVKALSYGIKAIGSPYSQEKRMLDGFYDCSSLAWRSYHSANVNFGATSWAPTAAGLAQYCDTHKKTIANEAIEEKDLEPGDLLFFARDDNGRYKNIYHVAVYAGTIETSYSYGENGETQTYKQGLLLEARNDGVGLFRYDPYARNVVVVARPTK